MKAVSVHEMDAFTRGGDPYGKLGIGHSRHVRDAYAYWTYDEKFYVRKYFMHFPAMDLKAEIILGFINALGSTELTGDPARATAARLSWWWGGVHNPHNRQLDPKIKKILTDWFHDNKDSLIGSATNGINITNKKY